MENKIIHEDSIHVRHAQLLVNNIELGLKNEDLEEKLEDLGNLCGSQKSAMCLMLRSYEKHSNFYLDQMKKNYIDKPEGDDSSLSYVMFKGDKIISSSHGFKDKFYFKPKLFGLRKSESALKSSRHKGSEGVAKFLKSDKTKIERVIIDGKGKLRVVCLIKYKPEEVYRSDMEYSGKLESELDSVYTKVDVYDLGVLKGTKEHPRIDFNINMRPSNQQEFLETKYIKNSKRGKIQRKIQAIFKKRYRRLVKRYGRDEVKPLKKMWDERKNGEDFLNRCNDFVGKLRKKVRRSAEKKGRSE